MSGTIAPAGTIPRRRLNDRSLAAIPGASVVAFTGLLLTVAAILDIAGIHTTGVAWLVPVTASLVATLRFAGVTLRAVQDAQDVPRSRVVMAWLAVAGTLALVVLVTVSALVDPSTR